MLGGGPAAVAMLGLGPAPVAPLGLGRAAVAPLGADATGAVIVVGRPDTGATVEARATVGRAEAGPIPFVLRA